MRQRSSGFTLIELMVVISIIGILASLAISAYQTYTVRAQVSEGLSFAAAAKVPVADAYTKDGAPPIGRAEAGMTPAATDSRGRYVSRVDIVNGRVDVTFGNEAHPDIQGDTVSLTPYSANGNSITWRCGNAPAPSGSLLTGGGITAAHRPPTVEARYLPAQCR